MRATLRLLLSLLAVLTVSACESETGILIRASASESLGAEISGLRFYVGKNEVSTRLYYSDREPLGDVALEGRDIASDPYKLLLTPRGTPADEDAFVVAVLALGADGQPVGLGRLANPVVFSTGKVLQWDLEIVAIGGEVIVTDTGCLKYLDEVLGEYVHIGVGDDADCDGYSATDGDCNDLNPAQSPGVSEDCGNGVDDNCNGLVDDADTADFDDDGYAACGAEGARDCNDNNGAIYPGALESCDGLDNDCNGSCDDGYDVDGDNVSICGTVLSDGQCIAEGTPDCDDEDPARRPGNAEICDGIDNDCNGVCEDNADLDPDGDRYTDCGSRIGECGVAEVLTDCDPSNADVHPGAAELCDGIDNDCDGSDASISPCFTPGADQSCQEGVRQCSNGELDPACVIEVDASASLLPDFCSAYETCKANPAIVDPFSCFLDGGNQQPVDEACQVAIVGEETCLGNRVRVLPTGGAPVGNLCTYAIIGGQIQQGYSLTLVADANQGPVVNACEVDLIVQSLPGAGDSTINIFFDDGVSTTEVIQLRLKAHRLGTCAGTAGLTCATWPASLPQ